MSLDESATVSKNIKHLFHVHIIESPSADDLLINRREGELLSGALRLMDIKSQYWLAVNKDAFAKALTTVFLTHNNAAFAVPIIHLSAHGVSQGIKLTSGEYILWSELGSMLCLINKALNGYLLLCMSSCEGYTACVMAFNNSTDMPFNALIGNKGKPLWSETLLFFTSTYHLLGKGVQIDDALKASNAVALCSQPFEIVHVSDVKKSWALYELLKDLNANKFLEQIPKILENIKATTSRNEA